MPYTPNRLAYLTQYEIDREDALETIDWYARSGRRADALDDVRHEIQIHFANRSCNSPSRPTAFADWLAELHALLAVRREIPATAAAALRRMPQRDVERAAAFDRWAQ